MKLNLMRTNKIMILTHTLPESIHHTTLLFKNILPVLRKKMQVEVVWLVYLPNRIPELISQNKDEKILDVHNYQSFVEILNSEKPDLIYAAATFSLMDYGLSTAAKFLKIPVLSRWYNPLGVIPKKRQESFLRSCASRFFESSVPTDSIDSKKQFMRRGRFFLFKYRYLLKTLQSCKLGKINSFLKTMKIFKYFLKMGTHEGLPEFANDLHWLENEQLYETLVELGYSKDSLVVTGNPMYDSVFEKLKNFDNKKETTKIDVLFAPLALYEHGMMSKQENEETIKKTIIEILKNREINVSVKLHPSTQILENYQKIINESVPIFHQGDILDHLAKNDILITYPGNSSILVFSLMMKKPMILCNYFNRKPGVYVENKLAIECIDPKKLVDIIHKVSKKNPIPNERIEEFVKEFFYKPDGKASERLCDAIIGLINKYQKIKEN